MNIAIKTAMQLMIWLFLSMCGLHFSEFLDKVQSELERVQKLGAAGRPTIQFPSRSADNNANTAHNAAVIDNIFQGELVSEVSDPHTFEVSFVLWGNIVINMLFLLWYSYHLLGFIVFLGGMLPFFYMYYHMHFCHIWSFPVKVITKDAMFHMLDKL